MKIFPLVILTKIALGLPLVNTMGKRMTQTAIMMTEKRGLKPLFFCAKLPLDKCGPVWYNSSGDQRAALGCSGPFFRSLTPYGKFSVESQSPYARHILPKLTGRAGSQGPRRVKARAVSNFYERRVGPAAYAPLPKTSEAANKRSSC